MTENLGLTLTLLAGAAAIAAALVWLYVRGRRRTRALAEPFPPEWRTFLTESVPLYARMPDELRQQLEPVVRAFLKDVRFVGCNGLEVTQQMRLVIATQACLLVVKRNREAYRDLMSVLVYPDEFVVQRVNEDEAGVVTEFEDVLSGEAHDTSKIILSWRDIEEPPAEDETCNVVLHELAHYLDNSIGGLFTDLASRNENLAGWHEVLEDEYEAHCEAVDAGDDTLVSPDGAEHPAEFFAYATEIFFELPQELQALHPRLYDGLKQAYGLDPAAW